MVCLVCLVFWLNETNQLNQINQINKTNQINQRDQMDQTDQACPRRVATEVPLCRNGFSRNLLELKRQRRGVGYPRLAVHLTPTLWLTLLLYVRIERDTEV